MRTYQGGVMDETLAERWARRKQREEDERRRGEKQDDESRRRRDSDDTPLPSIVPTTLRSARSHL